MLLTAYILIWILLVSTNLLVALIDESRITTSTFLRGLILSFLWPLLTLWYGLETFFGGIVPAIITIKRIHHNIYARK